MVELHRLLPFAVLLVLPKLILSFSGKDIGSSSASASPLFDRFTPTCPASSAVVQQFDPSISSFTKDDVWVTVFRSFNNKPSVLIKDEFLNAMRSATNPVEPDSQESDTSMFSPMASKSQSPPVAIARLHSNDGGDTYVLDSMRSLLKKEETDASCDGSSEHTEALCVAIDALLARYLKSHDSFEGVIRTKSTLVTAPLLEDRGFRPIERLGQDMTTHTSSLDDCLECYARRAVSTSRSPGARQRAMDIVTALGRIDRRKDISRAQQQLDADSEASAEEGNDYDPWKNMRNQL